MIPRNRPCPRSGDVRIRGGRGGRGLTLVELLASLAILALLASALAAWTRTSGEAGRVASERLPWDSAADMVLQRIAEDILIADESNPDEPRVRVDGQRLVIRTRDRGPVVHEYALDSTDGLLVLTVRPPGARVGAGEAPQERMLIDRVSEWSCVLDEETSILTVSFTSAAEPKNRTLSRRYDVR